MAKKILIYSVTFYPHQGGMEKNSELLAQEFHNSKVGEVTLFTKSGLEGLAELSVPYLIVRSTNNLKLMAKVLFSDIIIINGGVSLPIAIVATLFRKPLVPIFQMAEILGKPANESKLKVILKKKALRWCFKIVGVSQACLDSREIPQEKGVVIYNPIDPFLESYLEKHKLIPLTERSIDLLFAGRMIEGKGIFILLDSLKILDDKGLVINVLFSGNGTDEDRFKQAVLSTKFQHVTVSFQDFVRGDLLAQTYMKTKCMVLPSHSHTEGSPLSIAEALTFGSAIIHSDQPAMIEQTAEAGIAFESGNAIELANKIQMLFDNTNWDKIRQTAKKRSEMFSSKLYRQKLGYLFKDLKN